MARGPDDTDLLLLRFLSPPGPFGVCFMCVCVRNLLQPNKSTPTLFVPFWGGGTLIWLNKFRERGFSNPPRGGYSCDQLFVSTLEAKSNINPNASVGAPNPGTNATHTKILDFDSKRA